MVMCVHVVQKKRNHSFVRLFRAGRPALWVWRPHSAVDELAWLPQSKGMKQKRVVHTLDDNVFQVSKISQRAIDDDEPERKYKLEF